MYFAQTRIDRSMVKIGYTTNLTKRKANMSVSAPGGIHFIATLKGDHETEQYLHDKFASYRSSGEWFRYEGELEEFVRKVQNGEQVIFPIRDPGACKHRSTAEYASDAMEITRQIVTAILNKEHRGIGDTVSATIHRVATRHGIPYSVLHRLRYRHEKADIWAGEYLHLKAIYEAECLTDSGNVVDFASRAGT